MQLVDLSHLPIDRNHDDNFPPPGGGSSYPFIYIQNSGNLYRGPAGMYHVDMISSHPQLEQEMAWRKHWGTPGIFSGRVFDNHPLYWYDDPPGHEMLEANTLMGAEGESSDTMWEDDPEPPTQPRNVQRVLRSYYEDFLRASGRFWEPADAE